MNLSIKVDVSNQHAANGHRSRMRSLIIGLTLRSETVSFVPVLALIAGEPDGSDFSFSKYCDRFRFLVRRSSLKPPS